MGIRPAGQALAEQRRGWENEKPKQSGEQVQRRNGVLVNVYLPGFAHLQTDRNLNLHQAAFTNDVGSAAFALRNGQPYNSVYKGTLPIHAASLAGSRDVLKMLIDAGADVNAARYAINLGGDSG